MPNSDRLPKFKYQPNLYNDPDTFVEYGTATCECCGKTVDAYLDDPFGYGEEMSICLECVANGAAAKKHDGRFVEAAEDGVDNPEKTEELFKRTPGYPNWQGEYWLVHCKDYCAYLGSISYEELKERDLLDKVEFDDPNIWEYIDKLGIGFWGYLFQCRHCGKYRVHTECD